MRRRRLAGDVLLKVVAGKEGGGRWAAGGRGVLGLCRPHPAEARGRRASPLGALPLFLLNRLSSLYGSVRDSL